MSGVWLHTASHSSGILAQWMVPGVSIKGRLWEVKECKLMEREEVEEQPGNIEIMKNSFRRMDGQIQGEKGLESVW